MVPCCRLTTSWQQVPTHLSFTHVLTCMCAAWHVGGPSQKFTAIWRVWLINILSVSFSWSKSHSVAQADLQLTILSLQPVERGDYWCAPPCLFQNPPQNSFPIYSSKGKAGLEILKTQSWFNSSNKADFVGRVTSAVSLIRVKHMASNCFSKLEGEKNPEIYAYGW